MRLDRLAQLADYLENHVKDEWFDIDNWAQDGFEQHKCGTAGCAIGFACTQFPEWGLRLTASERAFLFQIEFENNKAYSPQDSFFNIAKCFEITYTQATFLFMPNRANTRREDMIKHIRNFIKGKTK